VPFGGLAIASCAPWLGTQNDPLVDASDEYSARATAAAAADFIGIFLPKIGTAIGIGRRKNCRFQRGLVDEWVRLSCYTQSLPETTGDCRGSPERFTKPLLYH
jgi:hypothetical protein